MSEIPDIPAVEEIPPENLTSASRTAPRSTPKVSLVWHPTLAPDGMEQSDRLRQAHRLMEITGALHWREVRNYTPDNDLAAADCLAVFHDVQYVGEMQALSNAVANVWQGSTLGIAPATRQSDVALVAAAHVAATRTAVRTALRYPTARVLCMAGNQIHADRSQSVHGHIFNDVLLALMDAHGTGRVVFLNLDADHPRLVQEKFYNDPNLLLISLHEAPAFQFPFTGYVRDSGAGAGRGYTVNIPLPPGAGDKEQAILLEQFVVPMIRQYAPELLIVYGGGTAHYADPSAHLRCTAQGYQNALSSLLPTCERVIVMGGDGVMHGVMARLWTLALATLAERTGSLPPTLPAAYARQYEGGTFHDEPLPTLSDTYHAFVRAEITKEVDQLRIHLGAQWKIPDGQLLPEERKGRTMRGDYLLKEAGGFVASELEVPSMEARRRSQAHFMLDEDAEAKRPARIEIPLVTPSNSAASTDEPTDNQRSRHRRGRREDNPISSAPTSAPRPSIRPPTPTTRRDDVPPPPRAEDKQRNDTQESRGERPFRRRRNRGKS